MELINVDVLRGLCTAKIEDFYDLGEVRTGMNGKHIFIDNGADVLAVAHLDTVAWGEIGGRDFATLREGDDLTVFTKQLDDRLGVYVILYVLPRLGVKCDVLLTEGEEMGRSTASDFEAGKKYNWMFSFDRRGTDVVLYDYEDEDDWHDAIQNSSFKIGWGTFSDISSLRHLGVCGMNVGTGYQFEHTDRCHAMLKDTLMMAYKFVNFWMKYKDTMFTYTPKFHYGRGTYGAYDAYGYEANTNMGTNCYYDARAGRWVAHKTKPEHTDDWRWEMFDEVADELCDWYGLAPSDAERIAWDGCINDNWSEYNLITMGKEY